MATIPTARDPDRQGDAAGAKVLALKPGARTSAVSPPRTPRTGEPVRVLIVDDHPAVRLGIGAALTRSDDICVVGECADLASAVDAVRTVGPDVVLLDLQLGRCAAGEVVATLREQAPEARIIAFTAHDDEETIFRVVEMGVQGYLLKGVSLGHLRDAIRVVAAGGTALQPCVATKLVQRMRRATAPPAQQRVGLSPREREVLGLIVQGKSNREIAVTLTVSERTVKYHVSSILGKLNAANRTEAVRTAIGMGLAKYSQPRTA